MIQFLLNIVGAIAFILGLPAMAIGVLTGGVLVVAGTGAFFAGLILLALGEIIHNQRIAANTIIYEIKRMGAMMQPPIR